MDVKSQACFVSVNMLAMSFIQHHLLAIWTVPVGFPPCIYLSFFLILTSYLFCVNTVHSLNLKKSSDYDLVDFPNYMKL